MIVVSLLFVRFCGEQFVFQVVVLFWFNKKVILFFQVLLKFILIYLIYIIVVVVLFVSFLYIGFLEDSLFDVSISVRKVEWLFFVEGSCCFRVGEDIVWKWQNDDLEVFIFEGVDYFVFLIFVFFEIMFFDVFCVFFVVNVVLIFQNLLIKLFLLIFNFFSIYVQDSVFVFLIFYSQVFEFFFVVQEIFNDEFV